jgi:hypothetical protein
MAARPVRARRPAAVRSDATASASSAARPASSAPGRVFTSPPPGPGSFAASSRMAEKNLMLLIAARLSPFEPERPRKCQSDLVVASLPQRVPGRLRQSGSLDSTAPPARLLERGVDLPLVEQHLPSARWPTQERDAMFCRLRVSWSRSTCLAPGEGRQTRESRRRQPGRRMADAWRALPLPDRRPGSRPPAGRRGRRPARWSGVARYEMVRHERVPHG